MKKIILLIIMIVGWLIISKPGIAQQFPNWNNVDITGDDVTITGQWTYTDTVIFSAPIVVSSSVSGDFDINGDLTVDRAIYFNQDSMYIGGEAGTNNTGQKTVFVGYGSGRNNSGDNVNGYGKWSVEANSGDRSNGFGYNALADNTGEYCSGFGHQALKGNTGIRSSGIGYAPFEYNTGDNSNAQGYYAGRYNKGDYVELMGTDAGHYNAGNNSIGIGYYSLNMNTGTNVTGIGYKSLFRNGSANNTAIGSESFNNFTENGGGAKTFASTDIIVANDTIFIPAHGFGSVGTYANLKWTATTGTLPAGISLNQIDQFKITHTDTIVLQTDDMTDQGSGNHTLTPQALYSNSTALGYDAEPTASNQVMLGNANVTQVVTAGDIYCDDYIYYDSDVGQNTYIKFNEDRIIMTVGGVSMFSLYETSQDEIQFNQNNGDVDFRVRTENQNATLFVDGANDKVGILGAPDSSFTVNGSAHITTNLLVDGNTQLTGSVRIGADLLVDEYIYNAGDLTNSIRFTGDNTYFYNGSINMLGLVEGSNNHVIVNDGGVDVNFRVESNGVDSAFVVNGSNGNIFAEGIEQTSAGGLVLEYNTSTKEIYAETSTKRTKSNIQDANLNYAGLLDLNLKTYNNNYDGGQEIGLIAEEVAKVMPELVIYDQGQPLAIKSTKFAMVLLEIVKQQQKQIDELKAKVQ